MGILEVNKITIKFGGLTAVSNFSLNLNDGEIVGLIGPNGAGKTTAFNAITGIYPPTSGNIVFRGNDITGAFTRQNNKTGHGKNISKYTTLSKHVSFRECPGRPSSQGEVKFHRCNPLHT